MKTPMHACLGVQVLLVAMPAMAVVVDLNVSEPAQTVDDPITSSEGIEFHVSGKGAVNVSEKTTAGAAIVYSPVLTEVSKTFSSPRLQLNVEAKAFDDATLEEYEPYALSDVAYVRTDYSDKSMPLYSETLHMESPTNGVCQFMAQDGGFVKCLKVSFCEKENENHEKSIWICNTEQWYSTRQGYVDFDTIPETGDPATGKKANTAYCLGTIVFRQKTAIKREVRHLQGLSSPNLIRIEPGVQVVACGSNVPVVQWEMHDEFTVSGVQDLTLNNNLRGPSTLHIGERDGAMTTVTMNGSNTMTGGHPLDIWGTVTISAGTAIPPQGVVTIHGTCNMEAGNLGQTKPTTYRVEQGGVLRSEKQWGLSTIVITNAGGTVNYAKLDAGNSTGSASGTSPAEAHLTNVTLEDGARIIGYCPRFQNGLLRVRGNSPSTNEAGLVAFGLADGTVSVIDVADVTGNVDPDLVMSGPICNMTSGNYGNVVVRKTGLGTVRFDHVCPLALSHPLEIHEGTWLVGVSNGLPSRNDIIVKGGSFAVAKGVSCDIGTLEVSEDSSLVVGEGGCINIKDSAAISWSTGKTLNIIGSEKCVRFGTSSMSLTSAQIESLRMNGAVARLNRSGYVTSARGMMVIVR